MRHGDTGQVDPGALLVDLDPTSWNRALTLESDAMMDTGEMGHRRFRLWDVEARLRGVHAGGRPDTAEYEAGIAYRWL